MTVDPGQFHTMTPPPQPLPLPPPKSNGCWKFALIGCGIVVLLAAIGAAGLVFGIFGVIKRSDVYTEAKNRAAADSRVIAALGQPIKTGWMVSGSVNISNGSGNANLGFSISGPKGEAQVNAVATREFDRWNFTTLKVKPSGGSVIDVLRPER